MALEINIPDDAMDIADEAKYIFLGEDVSVKFQIGNDDATLDTIDAGTATMVDVSGWAMTFIVRTSDTTLNAALITKTTGSGITIAGSFNATASVNTQRVVVSIEDTDIPAYDGSTGLRPKTYRYSLKRTDAGSEKILAFGNFVLSEATARA